MLYILSLIFGAIATAIDLFSKMMRSKKYIIVYMTLGSLFFVASYICLKNPLSAIYNGINLARGIIYIMLVREKKSYKHYIAPLFILLSALGITLYFFWSGPIDLLIFFATAIATIALTFKNTIVIRLGLIISSSLWIFYNIHLKAYTNLICNIGNIVICIGAIIVYNVVLVRRKKAREAELNDEPPIYMQKATSDEEQANQPLLLSYTTGENDINNDNDDEFDDIK